MQFPRCLAALYGRIDDIDVSEPLLRFLSVEHWGSNDESAHWKQFERTLNGFGISLDAARKQTPFDETERYLEYRLRSCFESSVEEALGNIAFAHEFVNGSIFHSYLEGMEKLSFLDDQAIQYFRSHTEDEPYDYQILKEIILWRLSKGGDVSLVRKGALDVLSERYRFFDEFMNRISD